MLKHESDILKVLSLLLVVSSSALKTKILQFDEIEFTQEIFNFSLQNMCITDRETCTSSEYPIETNDLTLSYIMLKNDQTYFKNRAVLTPRDF